MYRSIATYYALILRIQETTGIDCVCICVQWKVGFQRPVVLECFFVCPHLLFVH